VSNIAWHTSATDRGPRARYLGVRKNTFDLRRLAAVQNLETLSRRSNTPTSKVTWFT
jgi:hypothetical protein